MSFKRIIVILCCTVCLSSCQDWTDEKFIATVAKECNYNVIGISGPPSAEPYVEIQYNKDDGHGNKDGEMINPSIRLPDMI
ncbi:MAG: hypothetical protein LBU44_09795 [Mediterranea sp.]|jgi:hypothetical protein|nr:hypothetical protein [Mediterranea sp.]